MIMGFKKEGNTIPNDSEKEIIRAIIFLFMLPVFTWLFSTKITRTKVGAIVMYISINILWMIAIWIIVKIISLALIKTLDLLWH